MQKQGFSHEKAMELAMANFGDEKEVGKQLQHALYPYRREMMLSLASASLLFIYSTYLLQLFTRGHAEITWLCLAVLISAAILTLTLNPITALHRRLTVNGLLIGHALLSIYGSLLAMDLETAYSIPLTIFSYAILLFSIVLVYRTTIYDFPSSKQTLEKDARRIHFINITFGLIVMALSLFLLWAFLIFAEEIKPTLLLFTIPLVMWAITYTIQLHLLATGRKKWTYSVTALQFLWIIAVIIVFTL
ncbi:hypothetical protein [Sporosarcina ureae]|uniref:hypothetical protein n=1 Tax=Sporosarcina ureae TaxID=1571 RepID=UPI0009DC51D9|nr:hypothetical protein [Sporosarcina ureae]ARF16941.1 hypothetical protein SporoP17a_06405 [Sporosarcina ureae]